MKSISKIFNISEDYTLEQLKSSYISIIENLSKSNLSDIEKDLLSEQYKKLYKQGKQLYLERITYDTELESNEINLFDKFEMIPYNYYNQNQNQNQNHNHNLNQIRRFQDKFSKFDNYFEQMANKFDKSNLDIKSQVYSYSSSYKSKLNSDGSRIIIESKSESKNGDKKNTINAYKKMSDGKIIPLTEDEMKQIKNSNYIQNHDDDKK